MDHKTDAALTKEIADVEALVTVGAHYVHYKNVAQTYTVLGFVVIQATQTIGVLYKANYGGHFTFVRPASDWIELVAGIPRFTKV